MSFCSVCGEKLKDGAMACDACGAGTPSSPASGLRESVYVGKMHKCPACGSEASSFEAFCSSCGHEFRDVDCSSIILDFTVEINRCKSVDEKIDKIKTYPIPNTKEAIMEMALFASSNFDIEFYMSHLCVDDVSDAWLVKIEQCHKKAKILFPSTKYFVGIQEIYDSTAGEVYKRKKQRKMIKWLWFFGAVALTTVFVLLAIFGIKTAKEKLVVEIAVDKAALLGVDYKSAEGVLRKNGFANITTETQYINDTALNGLVYDVNINGIGDFSAGDIFNKYDSVTISYYVAKIEIGYNHSDLVKRNFEDVKQQLLSRGFNNVTFVTRNTWEDGYKTGDVVGVSIDGSNDFSSNDKFTEDVKIVITYAICPISVTMDHKELTGRNYEDVINLLRSMGFTNIQTSQIKDVTLGWFNQVGDVKTVSIGGDEKFDAGDRYMPDTLIIVSYHDKID